MSLNKERIEAMIKREKHMQEVAEQYNQTHEIPYHKGREMALMDVLLMIENEKEVSSDGK